MESGRARADPDAKSALDQDPVQRGPVHGIDMRTVWRADALVQGMI